jgi:non-ribosomal peptide synthetase component E (peptide arylation enzyme)
MTVVMAQKFNFEKLLDSISRFRITHLMIVPPMAVLFCKVLDYVGHQSSVLQPIYSTHLSRNMIYQAFDYAWWQQHL